ncbi:MAG: peptidase MA family metallohydrolase [Terriglobales bacterium]
MAIPARMRALLVACTLVATATLSPADTLYLKNGMYIVVTRATEKDGQIEYWVGSTKYSISKTLVTRIEPGNGPSKSVHSAPMNGASLGVQDLSDREPEPNPRTTNHAKLQLPVPGGPKQNEPYWTALRGRILQGDRVNEMKLAEIELDDDARTTSNAYFLAGVTEMQGGSAGKASAYFENALRATPEQANLLEWHAIALSAQGQYPEAARELEHATALHPDSAHLQQLLGLAQYDADRTGDAVAAWKRAMELSRDPNTERLLRKAERELDVEERSRRKQSAHFILHYQGGATSAELQQQLLATMEDQFRDLASQLGYEPSENIIVILYTQKEFSDVTQAPSWAGALNDGKLRIPIRGVTVMNPELERVLKHELTHSFLRSLADGRCPTWLNEGMAELMEPRSSSTFAQPLAALFQQRKEIPFSVLEHPFLRFSDLQAQVAYAESLSAVEYLRERYGMGEVMRMLRNIGSGVEPELALRQSTGMDYSAFQQRIGEYLAKAGGN